jgi:hypothetical protein
MAAEIVGLIAGFFFILNGQRAICNLLLLNHHWHSCIISTPLLFSKITVSSLKSLHSTTYLLSLSQQVPLDVVFSLNSRSSYVDVYEVALLLSQHSQHIHRIRCECYNWRRVSRALEPFTLVSWPLIEEIVVVGFGIVRGTHRMAFSPWELQLFFDWVTHSPHVHALNRTVIKSVVGEDKYVLTSSTELSPFHEQHGSRLSDPRNGVLNSGDLHVLHFSSLSDTILLSFVEWLAVKPQPSLTTLTIHTRFHLSPRLSTHVWLGLAKNTPAVQKITLPEIKDDFLELLEQDFNIWPAIAHLGFIHGPQKLQALQKMLASRSESKMPVQTVTIYCGDVDWSCDELLQLKRLAALQVFERV